MLTDQEMDILIPHLTPYLIRAILETGHFSTAELNHFFKVGSLPFVARYPGGIHALLTSSPDAEQIWNRLKCSGKEQYIRDAQLKEMDAFCALQTDTEAVALFECLPEEFQSSIFTLFDSKDKLSDQEQYYPLYQDLMKNMAKLTPRDTEGDTPLMFMILKKHIVLAKSLLVAGAGSSINIRGMYHRIHPSLERCTILSACESYTPLELAIKNKHHEMIELLIDYGADINIPQSAFHPLHQAIGQGDKTTVDILIARKADLTLKNLIKEPPLLFSSRVKNKHKEGEVIHKALGGEALPSTSENTRLITLTGIALAFNLTVALTLPVTLWLALIIALVPAVSIPIIKFAPRL